MAAMKRTFDVLGALAVVAFGVCLTALWWDASRHVRPNPTAQVLDPSTDIQAGEEWMGLYMRDQRAGYAHLTKQRLPDGWRFSLETRFRLLGAAGGEVAMTVNAEVDAHLALERFDFGVETGPAKLTGRGQVTDRLLVLEVDSGGETTRRELTLASPPVLRSLVGPLLGGRPLTPGETFTFQVFDPLTQRDEPLEVEVVGPTTLVVLGQEVPVTHVRERARGVTLEAWINGRGEALRQELGLGLVAVRETEEEARFGLLQARAGRAGADLRALTAIPVEGMPANLKQKTTLHLRLGGLDLAGLALDDDRQRLEGDVLTIRREVPGPGRPLGGSDPDLAAEPLVQADHPRVQAMARRIVGDATDTRTAAERIARYVHEHVRQELVAGVPSALEVLETLKGDCNEHAVLFAALARAAGVPTRIETGLAYQEGRFAWHAWNSVRLAEGWLTVDATWDQSPVDVGHLRLASGGLSAQADLLRVMGQLTLVVAP